MPIKKTLPTAKGGTKARVRLDPRAQTANAKAAKKVAREDSWPVRQNSSHRAPALLSARKRSLLQFLRIPLTVFGAVKNPRYPIFLRATPIARQRIPRRRGPLPAKGDVLW